MTTRGPVEEFLAQMAPLFLPGIVLWAVLALAWVTVRRGWRACREVLLNKEPSEPRTNRRR